MRLVKELFSLKHTESLVKRVDGLRIKKHFNTSKANGCMWYLWLMLDVVLHFSVLIAPSVFLISRALQMQYNYSVTMAPLTDNHLPLMWYNVLEGPELKACMGKYVLPSATIIVLESLGYLGLALLRMLIHYCELPEHGYSGCFMLCVRWLFSWFIQFQLWVFITYVFLVMTWAILAAVLNPQEYLVVGVAVAVGVIIVAITFKQLLQAAAQFKSLVSEAFSRNCAASIHQSLSSVGHGDLSSGAETAREFDARELFSMLNTDGDDVLSIEEFKGLFTTLNIDISEEKQDKLLALCDIDCSDTIDEEEFVNAWDYFYEVFLEEAASQAGLSIFHVVLTVAMIALIIALVFIFLFVAIAAWSNESNFVTVIRSLVVTLMGGMVSYMRPRSATEGGDIEKEKKQLEESLDLIRRPKGDDGDGEGGDGP